MKSLLCILLLGYMIFGVTTNQKNRPSGNGITGGRDGQIQNSTNKQRMISRVVFLDAKGNILDESSELRPNRID